MKIEKSEKNTKLNDIQHEIIKVFSEFDKVCRNNKLTYFAIGGTCIGAVRHQGFIPWDDDVDVAMYYEDYLKFIDIANKELPYPFELLDNINSDHVYLGFSKVHNVETSFIEQYEIEYPERYKGIFIDVMPIMGTPNNCIHRVLYIAKCLLIKKIINIGYKDFNKCGTFRQKINWIFVKPVCKIFRNEFFEKKLITAACKYRIGESEKVFFSWRKPFPKEKFSRAVFPKVYFNDIEEVPFENYMMPVPKNYDAYLKQDFGDYMQFPPIEQQISCHGNSIIDIDKSFAVYAQQKRMGCNDI